MSIIRKSKEVKGSKPRNTTDKEKKDGNHAEEEKSISTDNQGAKAPQYEIEILARRLLPEIRKFFADEGIKREFAEWKAKKQGEGQGRK